MDDSAKTEGQTAGEVMKPAYVEAPEPSMAERKEALIHSFEHAAKHNAPVTPAMLKELHEVVHHDAPPAHDAAPAADDPSKQGSA